MSNPLVKLYEDDVLFLRDDVASGIIIDDDRRYSVFCKNPYHRLKVYNGPELWALEEFHKEYQQLKTEALDTNND